MAAKTQVEWQLLEAKAAEPAAFAQVSCSRQLPGLPIAGTAPWHGTDVAPACAGRTAELPQPPCPGGGVMDV